MLFGRTPPNTLEAPCGTLEGPSLEMLARSRYSRGTSGGYFCEDFDGDNEDVRIQTTMTMNNFVR
eukprot:23145-Heterocapsa_arctica.AAC.1